MKKILIGFIAIGFITFYGCDKDDDTDTTSTSSSIEYGEGTTDIDGNKYKSVIISYSREQEWMVENLKTTKYSDGTPIPNVTGNTEWKELETAAWCNYDNSSSNGDTYGKLYNWYAVETGKLCPTGWHVPTDEEWTELTSTLSKGHYGTEGTALKSTFGWYRNSGGNETDDYGWTGLPGGNRSNYYGLFVSIGSNGSWWSSSQFNTYNAWNRWLSNSNDNVNRIASGKTYGFSVRCLRD